MSLTQVRTYCTMCGVGCPSLITLDGDRVVSLEPDRLHPQGGAVCGKGRACPEIHHHPDRLSHPLRRTRPKDAEDPGWVRITWDEALDEISQRLLAIRAESGPEAVAFGRGTGSGTGLSPAEPWLKRLVAAFGSPNYLGNTHLCQWARDGISWHTYGIYPMPLPDVANSGCIVLWGANPAATWLTLATEIVKARSRGARLVCVDPRRVGLATKADLVLQLRPGTDGALALAMIGRLIALRAYDHEFVRRWTNAPLLVRADTGRLLRREDVAAGSVLGLDAPSPSFDDARGFVAVRSGDLRSGDLRLVAYSPDLRMYAVPADDLDLFAEMDVPVQTGGHLRCRTVFSLLADEAATWPTERAAQVCGIPADAIDEAVTLMVENRPVSLHTWNGIVQHTNGSQTGRAIEVLFALLGDLDAPGGNVVPMKPRTLDMSGGRVLPDEQAAKRLGRAERPLGPPAMPGNITAYDLFEAVLEARPYRVRGLLSFGNNTLLNTGDPLRGRAAFERLEFFAQAELFQTPTSRYADILLPAAGFLETDTLMITADGVAQRRRRSVMPRDERRPDIEVIFELAGRMGCGADFGGGDVARSYDEVLEPAGLTWAGLMDAPEGVRVTEPLRHRKYAEVDQRGKPVGFATRTGLVELFQDRWAEHGVPALPAFEEPAESPLRTPDVSAEYPLVLTNAKRSLYLHSQHRGVTGLRRQSPDPTVELHPETAARYGVLDHAWVWLETPRARVRARADLTDAIAVGVACANHGWWEASEELGLKALDPFSEDGANINLLVGNDRRDPISGGIPHRSSLCRVRPIEPTVPSDVEASSR